MHPEYQAIARLATSAAYSTPANKSKVTVNLQNIKELFVLLVSPSSPATLFSLSKHINVAH